MADLGEFRRWMASGKTDAERAAERRKELERQTRIRRARNERRNARRRARAALGVPEEAEHAE